MISMKKVSCLLSLVSFPLLSSTPQAKSVVTMIKEIPVEVMRLSERVLVLTDVAPNGVVTAISTDHGIVIIDTGVSWRFGKEFRRIAEREFKRPDVLYVINTHADRDHTFGNQAFKDAPIIAHENCRQSLQRLEREWDEIKDEYLSLHKGRAEKNIRELKEGILDPDQASGNRRAAAINSVIASDLSEGQEIIPPIITFQERMTLYSGDMALHLYYLGEGHSDADILIHVPQESLIVAGDAFLKSMLIGFMKQDRFDMARYSEILNTVLTDRARIKYVVCGHGPFMTADELLARRDYLNSLSSLIRQAYFEGTDLETLLRRLPLINYPNLTAPMGKATAELHHEHTGIIEKYWSNLNHQEPRGLSSPSGQKERP